MSQIAKLKELSFLVYGLGKSGFSVIKFFEKKGWPESTVVIRFWIISIILAMIGLATLKLR